MKKVLQKYIADTGLCSRRQAEKLISDGSVMVNKTKAKLGDRVEDNDLIEINGKRLVLKKKLIYIKLNKPIGYTCTNRKFEKEKNVFALVSLKERLFVAGRLDKNSRGLVVLTNDGDFANKLTHPRYEHYKKYEVIVAERKTRNVQREINVIKELKKGVDIGEGDGVVKAKEARYLRDDVYEIVLGEGKKRQIRRMLKEIGFDVVDLVRREMGRIKLGDLKEGEYKHLSSSEIRINR